MNGLIARHACRAARPVQSHTSRRYASGSSESSGTGGNVARILLGASIVAGGAYWANNTWNNTTAVYAAEKAGAKVLPTNLKPGNKAFKGGDQGFFDLKLDSVEEINHNTKKFRFALPDSDDVSGLDVASALITKYKGPEMQKPVIRPYTPVSDVDQKGFVDLIVKRYPNGPMSEHLHSMVPGQRLDFKGPIPKYAWTPNKHDHVVMIAGGTGITPMYQVARAIFDNPADKTKVTLVFGNQTEDDILLREELQHLENTYPQRFRAFYTVDKPPPSWPYGSGHVTSELLKTVLPEPKSTSPPGEKAAGSDKVDLKIFVCGPPGMYKAISGTKVSPQDQGELSGILKELGYTKEQVYKF